MTVSLSTCDVCQVCILVCPFSVGDFLESDYSIVEGSTELSSPIMIQWRQNQNPFTLMLSPVTIDATESKGLGFFINSETILPGSRATAGIVNVHNSSFD